ncbi:MAG: hypothetical protein GY708_06535 [Actinomycetia bacterium]|nr:hypothetical protein [Actinomycetes bacterium]
MSINNIIGSLRCELGVDPSTVQFTRPDPIEGFEEARDESIGVRSAPFDSIVRLHRDDEWSKQKLVEELERRESLGHSE